jgi:hypothetical protein
MFEFRCVLLAAAADTVASVILGRAMKQWREGLQSRRALIYAGVTLWLAALSLPSHAVTYNYVQTTGGSCCTVSSNNTVQVSDTTAPNGSTALPAGVFDIFVTLDTNWSFVKNKYDPNPADTLATGHAASFLFSTSLTLTSLTFVSPPTSSDFHVEQSNPGGAGTQMSPWAFPANAYGVSQNTSNETVYSTIDLRVSTGTTDTLAQFIATLLAGIGSGYPNILFAADVQDPSSGNTGTIGFTFKDITNTGCTGPNCGGGGGGVVPLPAAFWLFGSALAGLGLIGVRRRRRRTPSSF